ncbi:MAG: hypothetical protein WD078_11455 [Woeseia sp.]
MKPALKDLEAAMRDPTEVFASPEQVLAHAGLTREQKIEVLKQWGYDAAECEVATEEGMPGDGGSLLSRILLVLDQLGAEVEVCRTDPSKQHSLL